MLVTVRRNRWLIALLLLLFGQAGVVRASAAPTCPRSHDAAPELVSAAAGAGAVLVVVSTDEIISGNHEHQPPAEAPAALPTVPGCGGAALLCTSARAGSPPGEIPSYLHGDAVLPRLLAHAFFRPPRLS